MVRPNTKHQRLLKWGEEYWVLPIEITDALRDHMANNLADPLKDGFQRKIVEFLQDRRKAGMRPAKVSFSQESRPATTVTVFWALCVSCQVLI